MDSFDILSGVKSSGKHDDNDSFQLTKSDTIDTVENLNQLLASYGVHCQKLKNFYWNLTCIKFLGMRVEYEREFQSAQIVMNDISERIKFFDQMPYSTLKEFLKNSRIKESGTDLNGEEMIREILRDYTILLEQLYNSARFSVEKRDRNTESIIKNIIKHTEKSYWMFKAFLA